MIKCYVISSPSRNIDELQFAFSVAGIELIVVPAIWGPSLTPKTIESSVDVEGTRAIIGWRKPSLNEMGCALSHQEVYSRAIKSGCDWALVLEDDVSLSSEFFTALKCFELNFDKPTIVSFFSRGKRFVNANPQYRFGISNLFSCLAPPGQAAAYIINDKALKLTLGFEKVTGWADWPRWAIACDFYLAYPWLASEDGNNSLIPAQPLSKRSYWAWRFNVVSGLGYIKDKQYFNNYSEYSFWHIKTWILRIKFKLGLFIPMNLAEEGSLWVSRIESQNKI